MEKIGALIILRNTVRALCELREESSHAGPVACAGQIDVYITQRIRYGGYFPCGGTETAVLNYPIFHILD